MRLINKIIKMAVGCIQKNMSLDKLCANYQYISFDIFDTLIERKCKEPSEIFSLIEQKYNRKAEVKIHNFKAQRIMAEILSRKSSKNEEISLNDIYLRISDCYGDSIGKILRQLEIQTELEQCIAITPMVMLYNQYVNDSSKKVFITSDMYLPKDVIVDILKRNGIKKPQCLYVSCKEQQTKRSGRLFRVLRNENGIKKKAMLHIGDNPISDYLMAKLNGVDSYLIM